MRIGWIGLGNMGIPMVKNTVTAGVEVTVFNRTPKPNLDVGGATVVQKLEEAVIDQDALILMVSDGAAVKDILFAQKAVEQMRENTLVVNMSTIGVDETLDLAAGVHTRGLRFVDAPVLGSVKPATEGTLTVVAGGDEADFNELQPLFTAISKVAFHVGPVGKGAAMKLLVNAFLGMTVEALGECLSYAGNQSLATDLVMQVLENSAVWSPTLAGKRAMVEHERYEAQFALKHLKKDLGLAVRQGQAVSANMPAIETTFKSFERAESAGYGEMDMAAIVQFLSAGKQQS